MARTVHKLDDVFVAGGQPSLTYVQRTDVDVEPILAKAIATPNQLVSLSGPTKCGKTVLCRHVLRDREFIWIEGGQVANAEVLWNKVAYKLNKPREVTKTASTDSSGTIGAEALLKAEAAHSRSSGTERRFELDPMHTAIDHLVTNKVTLVVDDFHYLPQEARQAFLQNVKGAIFEGLKDCAAGCCTSRPGPDQDADRIGGAIREHCSASLDAQRSSRDSRDRFRALERELSGRALETTRR